jgi:hypothetical protein
MSRYGQALEEFAASPSPEGASELLSSALQASAYGEIDENVLMKAVLMVRDYIYRRRN